jgi:hypothetical protein
VTAHDAGYARFTVPLPAGADGSRLWRVIGELEGHVAVNVVDRSGMVALLTDAVVDTAISERQPSLTVDALPETRYREIAHAKAQGAIERAAALRAAWRTRPIADTASQLQTLLQGLSEVALLASLFARQRRIKAIAAAADTLVTLAGQLTESAFQFDDTVRASDDLHHEIVPVLARLAKSIGPR